MPTALEVTKKQLYSDSYTRYETESMQIYLKILQLLEIMVFSEKENGVY